MSSFKNVMVIGVSTIPCQQPRSDVVVDRTDMYLEGYTNNHPGWRQLRSGDLACLAPPLLFQHDRSFT
jgi:hypothetical protein